VGSSKQGVTELSKTMDRITTPNIDKIGTTTIVSIYTNKN